MKHWQKVIYFAGLCLVHVAAYGAYTITFPQGYYAPQYYVDNGEMTGFLPRLMQLFAEDNGLEFDMRAAPIKRYQLLLENGEVDFILPSNPAWADNPSGRLLFSNSILISRSGFVRRKEDAGNPIEAIATVSGYTLPNILPPYAVNKHKVIETIDTYASLGMLKAGRVDAVYAHLDFVRKWLTINQLENYLIFDKDAGYDNYAYHLATIEHPDIIDMFNRWLRTHQEKIDALKRQFAVGTESILQ